jgi:hypothetical protein
MHQTDSQSLQNEMFCIVAFRKKICLLLGQVLIHKPEEYL